MLRMSLWTTVNHRRGESIPAAGERRGPDPRRAPWEHAGDPGSVHVG